MTLMTYVAPAKVMLLNCNCNQWVNIPSVDDKPLSMSSILLRDVGPGEKWLYMVIEVALKTTFERGAF